MMSSSIRIVDASSPGYISEIDRIFREYQEFLDVDICFKDFEKELAELPGIYGPPSGALRLCMVDESIAGCVALCAIDADLCEMKRLYVRPEFRARQLGRLLIQTIVEDAKGMNYKRMGLDTLEFLTNAIHLYKAFGFRPATPYYADPKPEVIYWELDLSVE